ncbi:MAG: T9SS type A sorting domain-containing protein [Ginsengibacter sp.]
MKKLLPSLLILFSALAFQPGFSQTLYTSTMGIGSSYSPAPGSLGTPVIVFDDVNIPNGLFAGGADSIGLTKLKIVIVRYEAKPASVIKVYATPFDPASVGYDSLPAIPPVLIGTINVPANPGSAARAGISVGDSLNSFFKFKNDPSNVFTGFTTIFIGLSFSDPSAAGWELSDGPGANHPYMFLYNKDQTEDPRYFSWFGPDPNPPASFRMEVFGKVVAYPAPVVLTNFDVQTVNNKNVLAWSTSQESNSNYYSIEHSTDGNNFEAIGQIAAAGNSSNASNYTYTDANPAAGINYYRLKMVDLDNSVKYSSIKSVRNTAGNISFKAYPNPTVGTLYLDIPSDRSDRATLSVTNVSGQIVLKNEIALKPGKNTIPVKVNSLSSGTYIIKVELGNQSFIQKFNKQ